jgi:hypothetical protein
LVDRTCRPAPLIHDELIVLVRRFGAARPLPAVELTTLSAAGPSGHAFEAGMAWVFRKCRRLTPSGALLIIAVALLWLPISFGTATALLAHRSNPNKAAQSNLS